MEDLGSWLLSLRQEAKIELAALSEKTKIQRRHLEALEAGRFSELPSPLHRRAFALAHARACGADEAEALERVNAAFSSPRPPSRIQGEGDSEPKLLPSLEAETSSALPWRLWLIVGGGALLLLLLLNALVSNLRGPQSASMEKLAAGPSPQVTAVLSPETAPSPQSAAAQVIGEALDLRSRRPCWVVLEIDGKRLPTIFLEPDVRERYTVTSKAVLLAGNIGAVRVWWRGENLGYLGELGARMNGLVFEPGKAWRKDEAEDLALPPGVPSQAPQ